MLFNCTAWIPGEVNEDTGAQGPTNVLFQNRFIEAAGDDGAYRKCLTSPELASVDIETAKFSIVPLKSTH
jgi:hypothetical protein